MVNIDANSLKRLSYEMTLGALRLIMFDVQNAGTFDIRTINAINRNRASIIEWHDRLRVRMQGYRREMQADPDNLLYRP